jgi:outer membrane lipoprotein-sorting protein
MPFRVFAIRIQPVVMSLLLGGLTLFSTGCGKAPPPLEKVDAEPAPALAPAEQVLQRMVATYRDAKSYSDQAVVRLKYRQQGQPLEDEGPFAVSLVRPNKLSLRAYQLTLLSDGRRLRAAIADPGSNDMDGQIVVREVPSTLGLDTIYEDQLMLDVMSSGMGGPPVTLELLLSESPLTELLASGKGVELLDEGKIGDRACDRVQLQLADGQLVFWVDRQSHLLLRLEYPADRLAREMAAGNCTDVSLTAEFVGARVNEKVADEAFSFAVPQSARTVSRFVLPPQPLSSELIGQLPGDFHFTDLTGELLTRDSLLGKIAVLVWFNDHPASQAALADLERVRKTLPTEVPVACYAVCTEPTSVSHAQVQSLAHRWGSTAPLVRDLEAFGRDVFKIPYAPTVVVLDRRGVVQLFEVGANPNLASELPDRLRLLVAGEDLAAGRLAQFRQEQTLYQKKLDESSRLAPQDARASRGRLR